MKKLLCLLLTLAFTISLCACGNGEEGVSSAEQSVADSSVSADASAEESSEESKLPPPVPVINGNSIEEYTIVYVKTTDEATYEDVAVALQSYIKDSFGFELPLQDETAEETEKEIIIGNSNKRSVCGDYKGMYGYGEYKLVVTGSKVLLAASYATGCYQGYKRFVEMVEASKDGVFGDSVTEGEGNVVKVACVGDSITHGINSTNPDVQNYPHYLQEMLGLDYFVLNSGITDRSICRTDVYNYASAPQHMLAAALEPDVVIFILGSNDANPAHDYKSWTNPDVDRKALFVESANALLDDYVKANPDVQIYIGLPSSPFKLENDKWQADGWKANLVEYVIPLLKEIANDRKLDTINLFDWSEEHPELFPDGLHPKDEGYRDFAAYIYDCINDSIKKPL